MSLLKLIRYLSSSEKTNLLGEETTRILRYTFTSSDTEAVPLGIIDQALAVKEGTNLIYKNKLRTQLIDSLPSHEIKRLGFNSYNEAIKIYSSDVERFIRDFKIESNYKKIKISDNRERIEIIIPKYGECNGTNAFPHPYQLQLKDRINFQIRNNQNPSYLVTMPTGSGKTVLAMEVIIDLFRTYRTKQKELKIGWFVDSNELSEQSLLSFQKLWKQKGDRKVRAQRFYDRFDEIDLADLNTITFVSFPLISSRIHQNTIHQFLKNLDLIVIDEAHGAKAITYNEVIGLYFKMNKDAKLLGLTATPFRNDDTDHETLKGMFHEYLEIVDEYGNNLKSPMEFLIENGYLAQIQFQVLNAERGDSNSDYYYNLHENIRKECKSIIEKGENSIIFAQSKSHAIALNIYLTNNDVENELIVGETADNKRKDILNRFGNKKESLSIIVNHQILSTGIDVPGMNSIMVLSKINSPVLALQIIGRAMRGEKNGGNKSNTIYLTKDNYNKLKDYKILETIVLEK